MKKATVVLIAAIFLSIGTASAQQKIGHINSVEVLQAMPEFKTMQTDLQKQQEAYKKVLEGMYNDYDKKQKELQEISKENTTPDAIVEMKVQELQQLQQRIQEFEGTVNEKLQQAQQDKLKPINDKYLKAVKEVAIANGYAYVIDIVSGAVAYYPEGVNDVTDLVMKKLGITAAPQTPGNTPTAPKTTGQ